MYCWVKTLQKLGLVDSPDLAALAEEADGVSSFNVSIEKLIATSADLYVTGTDQEKWDAALRSDRAFAAWGPVGEGHVALLTDSDVNLAVGVHAAEPDVGDRRHRRRTGRCASLCHCGVQCPRVT